MKNTYQLVFLFLLLADLSFSYQLILKNGKSIQGTFVSEDTEKITVKDSDGTLLNFKKSSVDLDKTAEANKPAKEPAQPAVEEPKNVTPEPTVEKPKKPARKYTDNDLYRLRGEYPMDNTGAEIQAPGPDAEQGKSMSGEEWQQLTQTLLNQAKQAEQYSQAASAKCKELQGATIQTHVVVNAQNQPVDMVEATKQACQGAEDAKAQMEAARQNYQAAVEQARQQNVPPGYIVQE